jgi:AcrR family transcriptional regulator
VPVDVDQQRRLEDIAQATVAVVKERGAQGVTVRAVAEELGGSTTLVTNYLPTRADLLLNAVRLILAGWHEEMEQELRGISEREYFAAYSRWNCSTVGDDQAYRRLLIQVVAESRAGSDALMAIRGFSRENNEILLEAAGAGGAGDPAFVADVVHLVLRGFYLASLEDPERWTSERIVPIVERLVVRLWEGP